MNGDGALFAIMLVMAGSGWWAMTVQATERAKDVARRVCALNEWQLLDHTVSLQRTRPTSTSQGLRLARHYTFEFSTNGGNRHCGMMRMVGHQVDYVTTDEESIETHQSSRHS